MKQVLIVSAHPDDMEIGMGGTVAKMVATGSVITSVVLTDGRRSPNPFGWSEENMAEVRKQETTNAAGVLNAQAVNLFGLSDLKRENNYSFAKNRLGEIVRRIQPAEIYTLHPQLDRHPTHRLAGQLVIEIVRDERIASLSVLWAYEVWGLFHSWDRIEYIDEYLGKKVLAISEHKSQLASIPYSDGVMGLNRWRAVFADPQQQETKGTFAEAFISLSYKSLPGLCERG